MPSERVYIQGNEIKFTAQRARVDAVPGSTCTVVNLGPDTLETSDASTGTTPTTVASGASTTLTTQKWLRSLGSSTISVDQGRVVGVVI